MDTRKDFLKKAVLLSGTGGLSTVMPPSVRRALEIEPEKGSTFMDANNKGKYDGWLEAKRSGDKKYRNMPLTLGHYNRDDLPFNYALADAFTVCDHNFSSAMTSTWPNRLFFWTGNVRSELSGRAEAVMHNVIPWGSAHWKTFPDHLAFTTLKYEDKGVTRELPVPKGDVLYRFRRDVDSGELPTVSWLAPSQNLSDHPSAPWYGAWFTSEILGILTKNPDVWKKTVFILTYDENDGYFDHLPPFVAPDATDPETGKCSPCINTTGVEFVYREQELREDYSKSAARTAPVGLGFRVPMIVASPWSRGSKVCSEILDHTSTLQFLEKFLSRKFNKNIKQDNISAWRRTICGDLTSVFDHSKDDKKEKIQFLKMDPFIEKIYNAKFQRVPRNYKKLTAEEIAQINKDPLSSPLLPRQEPGIRPSCALAYELYVHGGLSEDKKSVRLNMQAADAIFGNDSLEGWKRERTVTATRP